MMEDMVNLLLEADVPLLQSQQHEVELDGNEMNIGFLP
jgi:hypothetical protein